MTTAEKLPPPKKEPTPHREEALKALQTFVNHAIAAGLHNSPFVASMKTILEKARK